MIQSCKLSTALGIAKINKSGRPPYCGIQSSLRVIDIRCGREPVHTMPKSGTKIHFQDRSGAASLRCKNRAEISDPFVKRSPIRYGFCVGTPQAAQTLFVIYIRDSIALRFEPFKRMYENGSKIALNSTCSEGFK